MTWEHAKPYSLTLVVLTSGWSLYNKYFWRMWPLKLFVRMPNLNGTWKAELESTYTDPVTGESRGLINAYVVIRQTFSSFSVRLLTEGGHESFSVASSFDIKEDGTTYVYGVYQGEPSLTDRKAVSAIHYGSFRYKVIANPALKLKGHYWTDRGTSGSIALSDRRSVWVDSYDSAASAVTAINESITRSR